MLTITKKVFKDLKSNSKDKVEKSFDVIYNEYSLLVYYVALKITKSQDFSQDVLNETFFSFYTHRYDIKDYKKIKYYLSNTAKNISLNILRRMSEVMPLQDNEEFVHEDEHDYFEIYIDKFKDFLDKEEIDLVVYHLFYDYTFKEIADMQNVSINVITSKYHRTIEKLKKHYGDDYEKF